MKNWIGVMAVLTLLVFSISAGADLWDDLADSIGTNPGGDAVDLPAMNSGECGYPIELQFTIEVLNEQTHQTWLAGDTTVETVLAQWIKRCEDKPKVLIGVDWDKRKADFEALKNVCDQKRILQEPFHALLRMKVTDQDVRNAVDNAVNGAGNSSDDLVFPLFTLSATLSQKLVIYLAGSRFCQNHTGKDSGGFGNFTYRQLYHTPALKDDFDNDKILLIKRMQDLGLLKPAPCIGQADGKVSMNATGRCCDVIQRVCEDGPGVYCYPCGTKCCLAGVSWCPYP